MAEQPVVIQKISWSTLCPWTIIFRTLPVASSFTVLALSLLGVVLTPIGWRASEALFIRGESRNDTAMMEIVRNNNSPYRGVFSNVSDGRQSLEVLGVRINGPREVFRQYVDPYSHLFDRNFGFFPFLYFLFGSLWSLAIWGFLGLAICRVTLMKLTRNEFVPLDDAVGFAMEKWTTVIGAILAPLGAVAAICVPMFLLGLLMGFDIGVMLVGVLWVVVLAASTAIGVLLFGLMFGWPLMVSSVGCESQNSFDAMTRAYAYTFQRPLHYLFYAILAILYGGICWMIVSALADAIVNLSFWTTSWGANIAPDRISTIINPVSEDGQFVESQTLYVGRNAIGLWNGLIRSCAAAFLYAMFWAMASAIYLLLRKDVDETEMDEIYVGEEKRTYQLPPLQSDANGIPQIQTRSPDGDSGDDGDSGYNDADDDD